MSESAEGLLNLFVGPFDQFWHHVWEISSKVKDKLITPTTMKETQPLVDLFGFWRHHNSYLEI